MATKKRPSPRPVTDSKPAQPTKPAVKKKTAKPAPPPSKAKRIDIAPRKDKAPERGISYEERVEAIIEGTATVVSRKQPSNDPFDLPDMDDLPDMPSMPDLSGGAELDPIEQAASDLRTFGPELDEDPVEEREDLTHEDRETARLDDLHRGFRERMKAEAARREIATDPEFWLCIVFQDRNQKDQFLTEAGWLDLGDKYIDGERLADLIEVPIDKSAITYNIGGADPKLAALVDIDPDYDSERQKPKPLRTRR